MSSIENNNTSSLQKQNNNQDAYNNNNRNISFDGNNAQFLCSLAAQIQSKKYGEPITKCIKLIDQGIHTKLISNLENNVNVKPSLSVICSMLSRDQLKIANKFVSLGLIQLIIKHCQQKQNTSECMNIIGNLIIQNNQYGQMMMQQNIHRLLFNIYKQHLSFKKEDDLSKEEKEIGFSLMWALVQLVSLENTQEYKQQFLEILQFVVQVYNSQHMYIYLIIQILFQIGYSFMKETKQLSSAVINEIVSQAETKANYIETMLILVKMLSPIQIDYTKIMSLAVRGQGKVPAYCIKILQRVIVQTRDLLPKNFEWWQRLYLKLTRPQDIQNLVSVLNKSMIRSQFVYPLIYDIMSKHTKYCITLKNQVLLLINSLYQLNKDSEQNMRKFKMLVKKNEIYVELQNMLMSCKNKQIYNKLDYLLNVINNNNLVKN